MNFFGGKCVLKTLPPFPAFGYLQPEQGSDSRGWWDSGKQVWIGWMKQTYESNDQEEGLSPSSANSRIEMELFWAIHNTHLLLAGELLQTRVGGHARISHFWTVWFERQKESSCLKVFKSQFTNILKYWYPKFLNPALHKGISDRNNKERTLGYLNWWHSLEMSNCFLELTFMRDVPPTT